MKKSKKDQEPKTTIHGLKETWSDIYLAYFVWGGTGEGSTIEAQIVFGPKYLGIETDVMQQIEIGFEPEMADLIPFVTKKDWYGQEYYDYNLEFKARFLECFGADMWEGLLTVIGDDSTIDLKVKMHYNLS